MGSIVAKLPLIGQERRLRRQLKRSRQPDMLASRLAMKTTSCTANAADIYQRRQPQANHAASPHRHVFWARNLCRMSDSPPRCCVSTRRTTRRLRPGIASEKQSIVSAADWRQLSRLPHAPRPAPLRFGEAGPESIKDEFNQASIAWCLDLACIAARPQGSPAPPRAREYIPSE